MPTAFDSNHLAKLFVAAHRSHEPVTADKIGPEPQAFEDVYAVQAAVMRELGTNGGFKTAKPDPAGPNVMAPILAANIRHTPAQYAKNEMRLVGIEIEIAFRIDNELPLLGQPDYDDRLRDAVSVVPVIEMVDSRLADRDGASDMIKLADNQSGFGLVVGTPIKDFVTLNLTNPAITFTVGGEQTGPTTGQIPGAVSAFGVLKDFLEVVGSHCGGISPGHYVTTGALSGLHWAEHGAHVAGSVAGLGEVSVVISR